MRTTGHRIGAYLKAIFVCPLLIHPRAPRRLDGGNPVFCKAPDHPEYNQVTFRVPSDCTRTWRAGTINLPRPLQQ